MPTLRQRISHWWFDPPVFHSHASFRDATEILWRAYAKPRLLVSRELLEHHPLKGTWYREAYRDFDMDCFVYAVPPLHLILRWLNRWRRARFRFVVERTLVRHGIMWKQEGDCLSEARFTPLQCWFRGRINPMSRINSRSIFAD